MLYVMNHPLVELHLIFSVEPETCVDSFCTDPKRSGQNRLQHKIRTQTFTTHASTRNIRYVIVASKGNKIADLKIWARQVPIQVFGRRIQLQNFLSVKQRR